MTALLNSLTDAELMLVRETEADALATLNEDDLVALHTRIRRARGKYTTSYRREASARVSTAGGRGKAHPRSTRNRQKAEVFEDALARVSRSLAVAARRTATELRSERVDEARRSRPLTRVRAASTPLSPQRPRRRPASTPAVRKRHAATRAQGARRQTKRDAR